MEVGERKRNFGNNITKICAQKNPANLPDIRDCIDQNERKKKKKLNCGKSNATTINYFNIFLKIVVISNFLLILIRAHQ